MTNTKERMIKLNQEGEYVHFRDIYVPKLGKCKLGNSSYEEGLDVSGTIRTLRINREEDGARYRIENAMIEEMDIENDKVTISYLKVWEGGLVEYFEILFNMSYKYIGKNEVGIVKFDIVCENEKG